MRDSRADAPEVLLIGRVNLRYSSACFHKLTEHRPPISWRRMTFGWIGILWDGWKRFPATLWGFWWIPKRSKKKGTAKQILSRLVLFLLMIGMKQGRIDRLPRWHFFGPRSEIQSESAGNPRNDWEIVGDSVRRVKDEENIHPRRSGRILSGFSADSQRILSGFSADSLRILWHFPAFS